LEKIEIYGMMKEKGTMMMKKCMSLLLIFIWIFGLTIPVSAEPSRVREAVQITENGVLSAKSYDGGMSLFGGLPEKFDLRSTENGAMTGEVRDQGITNSCWAFTALACAENFLRKQTFAKTGEIVDYDFSERHMEHASYAKMEDGTNPYAITGRSVNGGGNVISAAGYFQNGLGPVAEEDMPFSQSTSMLSRGEIRKKPVAQVRGMRYFPRLETGIFDYNFLELIGSIKEEIYTNGGVAAVMNTASGTWNSDETAYYSAENTKTADHAITLIGWDDTYSRENFGADKPAGDGAWIVQNSAGTDRHDGGYFYLSYANTDTYYMCASVTDAESEVLYERVYGTTSGTWAYGTGYENNEHVAYAANVYEKQAACEFLTDVSLDIRGYTEYEIYVVPDAKELSMENAVFAAKGTEYHMGFVTVSLPEPVALTGTEFAVIVKYHTPGYTYGVPVHIPPYCPQIREGVSFLSPDGVTWEDTATWEEAIGIFAYTVNETPQSEVSFVKSEKTYVSVFDESGRSIRLQPEGTAVLNKGTYRYEAVNASLGVATGSFTVDGETPLAVEITDYVKTEESDMPYLKTKEVSYRANLIPAEYVSIPFEKGCASQVSVLYEDAEIEQVTESGSTLRILRAFLVPLIEQGKEWAELIVVFRDENGEEITRESVTVCFTKNSFSSVYAPIHAAIVNPTSAVTESYVVNLIASNLAIGGEIYVNTYDVTYATERENGYLVCDILVLDAVSGRYFRFLYDGELLRVTQEVTKSGGYYRVNVRNNVSGIKTVNVYAEYDAFGRLLSVTAKNTAIISSSFIYKDNGHRVKIFTLLQKDMITPCTQVYVGE